MRTDERGDSLIEIILAIIVIGVVVSAVVAAISTSERGSATHRQLVTGDTVMRNEAEAVKTAVRTSCTAGGGTWTATYPSTMPTGFTVSLLSGQPCPDVATTSTVGLTVTLPNGTSETMDVVVRTP
jgi:type II secretory pathway pseudopilin PulG